MTPRPPRVHKVLLAANERDYAAAVMANPEMSDWTPIYRESDLYGLWITDWAITAMAANNMRQPERMADYLRRRKTLTMMAFPN